MKGGSIRNAPPIGARRKWDLLETEVGSRISRYQRFRGGLLQSKRTSLRSVAAAIAFAIEQPADVEINEISAGGSLLSDFDPIAENLYLGCRLRLNRVPD